MVGSRFQDTTRHRKQRPPHDITPTDFTQPTTHTVNYTQPTTIQPTTHNQLHTTNYTQPTTHNRLHTTNYAQPTTRNRLHTTNYTQSTTHNQFHTNRTAHNRLHTTHYTPTDYTQPTRLHTKRSHTATILGRMAPPVKQNFYYSPLPIAMQTNGHHCTHSGPNGSHMGGNLVSKSRELLLQPHYSFARCAPNGHHCTHSGPNGSHMGGNLVSKSREFLLLRTTHSPDAPQTAATAPTVGRMAAIWGET